MIGLLYSHRYSFDPMSVVRSSTPPFSTGNSPSREKLKEFVSVMSTSLSWRYRAGEFDIKLTQGVATSIHVQYNWTIPIGVWTHRKTLFGGDPVKSLFVYSTGTG